MENNVLESVEAAMRSEFVRIRTVKTHRYNNGVGIAFPVNKQNTEYERYYAPQTGVVVFIPRTTAEER